MKKVWILAALFAAGLSACGGGGSDPPPPVTEVIPSTVSTSVAEFIVYLKQLVVSSADTLEPLDTTTITPAVSDNTEPDPLT